MFYCQTERNPGLPWYCKRHIVFKDSLSYSWYIDTCIQRCKFLIARQKFKFSFNFLFSWSYNNRISRVCVLSVSLSPFRRRLMYLVTQLNGLIPSYRTRGFYLPTGKTLSEWNYYERTRTQVVWWQRKEKKQSVTVYLIFHCRWSNWDTSGYKKLPSWKMYVQKPCHIIISSHMQSLYNLVSVLLAQIHIWSMCISLCYIWISQSPVWHMYMWYSHNKIPGENFPHVLDQHQSCLTHIVCWHCSCLDISYWIILISICSG